MACFNGLSSEQQHDVLVRGVLEFGAHPAGDCPNGAEVAVETMYDATPGPRFMCRPCAIAYVTGVEPDKLVVRGVYRLRGRNLTVGVWNGTTWIGLREKFGEVGLDASEVPYRTCWPLELIEMLPEYIEASDGESLCQYCRTPTEFDRERGETWQERWYHLNNDTSHVARTMHYANAALQAYLTTLS